MDTLQGINISPDKAYLKMIFLFPRWDMLVSWRVYLFFSITVITHLLFGMIQVARHDTAALPTWCFVKFFDTLWRGRVWWIWHWHWRFQKCLEWGCLDGGLVGGIIRIFWSFVMTFSDRITTRVNVDGRTPQKGGRYGRRYQGAMINQYI